MNPARPLTAAFGYVIVTFSFAVVWHVALFDDLYLSWKYFAERPDFLLGLISIVIQGSVLAFAYAWLRVSPWKFVAVLGLYHWTVHVLAFMAKEQAAQTLGFFALETLYLAIQFGLFGLVLSLVWRDKN